MNRAVARSKVKCIMEIQFLKNAKKSELLAVLVTVCVLMVVTYGYFLLRPMLLNLGKVIPEAKKLSFDLERAKGDIARIPAIETRLRELGDKIDVYSHKLPTEEEFPALLESLSDSPSTFIGSVLGSEQPKGEFLQIPA